MKRRLMVLIMVLASVSGVLRASPDLVWPSDASMHAYFTDCFIAAEGNGYSRMIAPPMLVNDFMWLRQSTGTYKLGTLELIGVANHQSPVAFVDLLHRVPSSRRETRSLTAFEEKAIGALRAGGDLVVDEGSKRHSVVGALRAQPMCLVCHQSFKVGDLLGAFSYRLDRAKLPSLGS